MQRGLAAGGCNRSDTALERRHALLEHRVGGIGDAQVDVPAALYVAERGRVVLVAEHEGRGEIDRNRARAGDRVGPLARVQAERVELERSGCGHGVLLGVRPILAAAALLEDEKNPRSEGRGFKKTAPRKARFRSGPGRSTQPDRHVDLVALALYQEGDAAARTVHQAAQLLDGLHGLVVEGENTVAGLNARPGSGAFGLLHQQPAFGFDLFALLLGQRTHRQAELARLGFRFAVRPGYFFRRGLAERSAQLPCFALAPDLESHRGARAGLADNARQVDRILDVASVHREDDVAGLDPRLVGGTPGFPGAHQSALRLLQSEGIGQFLAHALYGDPEPPAADLAVLLQIGLDLHRDFDGDRERQSHLAAPAAVELRVDAEHLARHVEKRPAGVARIDGDVGLDERHVGLVGQRARFGRDDARGHGVLEAERRTDRGDPLADAGFRRVPDPDRREIFRVDLDQGDVGAAVHADDLRLEFAIVGGLHRDFVRVIDDVRVRQNITVRPHHEARADPFANRV